MATRNYGQACSVAHFLDRLGSRWFLLIVRDLLIGPRRFTQLLEGLPGIGTNRLTDRLAELQNLDVIRKTESTTDNLVVYELTEKGLALEPVILSMARWGLQYLHEDTQDQLSRPDLLAVAFRAVFNAARAKGIREAYEFHIDQTVFHIEIDDGKMSSGLGAAAEPAFIFRADTETFDQIAGGKLDANDARRRRLIDVIGDLTAYNRFLGIFAK